MSMMYDPNQSRYGSGAPRVRFEAIGEAWQLLTQQMGNWVLLMLLYLVVCFLLGIAIEAIMVPFGLLTMFRGGRPEIGGAFIGAYLVCMALCACVGAYFQAGLLRASIKHAGGGSISVNDLFSGGDVIGPMIAAVLLFMLIFYGAGIVCVLPFLLLHIPALAYVASIVEEAAVGALLALALPLVAERRAGTLQAFAMSWQVLKSNFGTSLGMVAVLFVILFVSAIPCGLGLFVSIPLVYLTLAVVYRDFFATEQRSGPQITMPMPPSGGPGNFDV